MQQPQDAQHFRCHVHSSTALMDAASDFEAAAAIRACRNAYQRVLAGWASDVLRLQRRGLHRLRWRGTHSPDSLNQAA